jgi:hypothetical protein
LRVECAEAVNSSSVFGRRVWLSELDDLRAVAGAAATPTAAAIVAAERHLVAKRSLDEFLHALRAPPESATRSPPKKVVPKTIAGLQRHDDSS